MDQVGKWVAAIGLVLVCTLSATTVGRAAPKKSPRPPVDLSGRWVDKWHNDIELWQEETRLVGAYIWAGRPAAIVGIVTGDVMDLRYYQAAGPNGAARCQVEDRGNRIACKFSADEGNEKGRWVMVRLPK